jgi:hypothetical protein
MQGSSHSCIPTRATVKPLTLQKPSCSARFTLHFLGQKLHSITLLVWFAKVHFLLVPTYDNFTGQAQAYKKTALYNILLASSEVLEH